MIRRFTQQVVLARLTESPAVALLGPRQVGKTTLAREIARSRAGQATYLDLEDPVDRGRLDDPTAYLASQIGKLVVLDEVHRLPGLFEVLRGQIDRRRETGERAGSFLILGSASIALMRQASESLAGRIAFVEMPPILATEALTAGIALDELWLRGGFPDSLLAAEDASSLRWRRDFVRTYLERDVPQFGFSAPAVTLERFWTMLAHNQAQLFNASRLADSLGVSQPTAKRYLDILDSLLLARQLRPFHANVGKRLVKSPKVFIRDSGLVHALLRIETWDRLVGHPVAGASYEGFVVENLAAALGDRGAISFFRTAAGAEIDLVVEHAGGLIAIEVKRSTAPAARKGFHIAAEDIGAKEKWLVYPGEETFPASGDVNVLPLAEAMQRLGKL